MRWTIIATWGIVHGTSHRVKHLYIVDASWFIFRSYYAIPPLTRADGTPVNAVFGFTNLLMKFLDDLKPDHVAIIFDVARKTFRNDIYAAYKANRSDPPEDLIPQFNLVRNATRAFNLACIEMAGFEADDLIATYTRLAVEAGAFVTIISSDKDMMQLVSDKVSLFDVIKNRSIGPAQVVEKFGVGPEKVVEVQALAGDATDNVPGVPGIGPKTAAQLIHEYGDVESLIARAKEIKQPKRRESILENVENARLSKRLVRLKDDVPILVPLKALAMRRPDSAVLLQFLAEQGFKSIITKVQHQLRTNGELVPDDKEVLPEDVILKETKYELVQTITSLENWVSQARHAGYVAIDTETTSLDESRAELVGVSMSIEPGYACYIPLGHRPIPSTSAKGVELESPMQIQMDQAMAIIRPLFADPAVIKIGQNIKYDMRVLAHYDVGIHPVDDTMLLSYVLDGGSHGHGMDALAEFHLGHTTIKYKEVVGIGQSQITFDHVPLDKALAYAAEDADVTLRLHRLLKPRLVREHMTAVYERLERPLIPVLASMESNGIQVNEDELKRLSEDFTTRMAVLETKIYELAGHPFNIASPKQLGEVLFGEMGFEGGKKTETGAYATGVDVLEGLSTQGHILPACVMEWRQISKLRSTYADALIGQINPRTGRIHTSYSMAGAFTGRLSSTDPNLQNIPVRTEEGRKIRATFLAGRDRQLLSLDYSQIELRLLAHIANVKALAQSFQDNVDIHAMTASEMFGVQVENMDPMVRRKAKAINFGIVYGISAFGLARQLGIEQSEAASYIKAYFERYPEILEYMDRTKQFCREHGYVKTLFGRRCHVPGILDKNPAKRSFAERASINAPIQGAAADILKRAMIRVPSALAHHELIDKAHMLLTVHDELLFEVDMDAITQTTEVVTEVMVSAALPAVALDVPLVVDSGVGDTWDKAH
ncbi:MAG: DNA polymerase I [Nitrospiraceae bacterium]|nr:DNA polymerase I [Nitrospiraceae bacterium]